MNTVVRRIRICLFIVTAVIALSGRSHLLAIGDADGDGIDDGLEQQLAAQFIPTIHFPNNDGCPDPTPHPILFRARHPTDGQAEPNYILITYVVLYNCDAGINTWYNTWEGHLGDNESFEVFLKWDGSAWQFNSLSATAHWDAHACQSWTASTNRDLWIGHDKHGSYASQSDCGCFGDDHCNDTSTLSEADYTLFNVGEPNSQFINGLGVVNSNWDNQTVWNYQPFWQAGVITDQLYNSNYYTITPSPRWMSCATACDDTLYDCQRNENDQDGHCEEYWNSCHSACGGRFVGEDSWDSSS